MKQIILLIIAAILLPISCRHSRTVAKMSRKINIDSTAIVSVKKINVDTAAFVATKKIEADRKIRNRNVNIVESAKETNVPGFTITSTFALDTSAKGDTVRLLSQEDDRVSVSIFYDKKAGKAIAQVINKDRKVSVPFRQVQISNNSMSETLKTVDSLAAIERKTIHVDSSGAVSLKKQVSDKTINKDVGGTVLRWWIIPVAAIFLFVAFWIISKGNVVGWLVDKFLNLKKIFKQNK